jgi:hypothetical protein
MLPRGLSDKKEDGREDLTQSHLGKKLQKNKMY